MQLREYEDHACPEEDPAIQNSRLFLPCSLSTTDGPRLRLFILDSTIAETPLVDFFGEKSQSLRPMDISALGRTTFKDVAMSESHGLSTLGNKFFLSAVATMSRLNTIWAMEQRMAFPSVREEDFDYASDEEKKKRLREWVRIQRGDGFSGGSHVPAPPMRGSLLGGGLDVDAFPTTSSTLSGDS